MRELMFLSALKMAKGIIEKKFTSKEIIEDCLTRINKVNPQLNAVVQLNEKLLDEAKIADNSLAKGIVKGPLHGVPVTIKDSFAAQGIISSAGTLGRKNYVPNEDAEVVKRLKKAGAIILGKTNTPELTLTFETDNLVYGRTNNPYDLTRSPGGSSGGEAAIIAAGASPLGIGSDTGGSIRYPAHCCGIVGIKPTAGRVPRTGHIISYGGLLDGLTQVGCLARYVEDLIMTITIISGPDNKDPYILPVGFGNPAEVSLQGLRIAYYTDNGIIQADGDTVRVVRNAVDYLRDLGISVTEDRPKGIEFSDKIYNRIFSADGGRFARDIIEECKTNEIHPSLYWIKENNNNCMSVSEYYEWVKKWDGLKEDSCDFMGRYDVVISPVNAHPALLHTEISSKEKRKSFTYTKTYNLTGQPVVVVPIGTSEEGLPIGIQLIGAMWREDIILALAQELEKGLAGFKKPYM